MPELGKTLIAVGAFIAAVGVLLMFSGKIPWLGKLPGDIYLKKENFSFFFPMTTCIFISLVISFILWLLRK